ncbi:hypothetical protein FRB95_006725 [Tulasnella sp. JGI-2019a]|nr:hypothetical protein FRB95_006725 [Tulasnella sp. JGI-2019a]
MPLILPPVTLWSPAEERIGHHPLRRSDTLSWISQSLPPSPLSWISEPWRPVPTLNADLHINSISPPNKRLWTPVVDANNKDVRRRHGDGTSVHPTSRSRRDTPYAVGDEGNHPPKVRPAWRRGRSPSPEAVQTVTQSSVDERVRAWVSSLNPPPPRDTSSVIIQVPTLSPIPTSPAPEVSMSYSRQHRSRQVHRDQLGDSSYRPAAVPASSRTLVRTRRMQPAAREPQALRKHVQPTRHRLAAVSPSSSHHHAHLDQPRYLIEYRTIAPADAYRTGRERPSADRHPHEDSAADGRGKGGGLRRR